MLLSQLMPHASAWSNREIEVLRRQYFMEKSNPLEQPERIIRPKTTDNPWLRQSYVI